MADIELVIRISQEDYEAIKDSSIIGDMTIPYVFEAIRNGTPLPKRHGRLKDVDKIITDGTSKGFCDWYDEMKYADTIIEADVPKRRKGTPLEENDSGYNCENWIP